MHDSLRHKADALVQGSARRSWPQLLFAIAVAMFMDAMLQLLCVVLFAFLALSSILHFALHTSASLSGM